MQRLQVLAQAASGKVFTHTSIRQSKKSLLRVNLAAYIMYQTDKEVPSKW